MNVSPLKLTKSTLALLALFGCWQGALLGEPGPQPPCGTEAVPPVPDVEHSPAVKVWDRASLGLDWIPPACLGWAEPGFTTMVTTSARFRNSAGAEGMLRRVGAISGLTGIRYWSTTHKRWQPLIVSASALTGPGHGARRQDFSTGDLGPDSLVYFQQSDSLSGKATYSLRMGNVLPDRVSFKTENLTGMRYMMLTLFPPHELQAMYFLERESAEIWRYYSITRTGKNSNGLAAGHDASTINRAVALFRYFAGIPTDQEPPAAR